MNHGTAISKQKISINIPEKPFIEEGGIGVITAYLPNYERFAVDFGNGKWVTFQWNEEEFLEKFKVIRSAT